MLAWKIEYLRETAMCMAKSLSILLLREKEEAVKELRGESIAFFLLWMCMEGLGHKTEC